MPPMLLLASILVFCVPARSLALQRESGLNQRGPNQTSSPSPSPLYSPSKDLFAGLFSRRLRAPGVPSSAGASAPEKRQIVCGLVLIPVDPKIDPRMSVKPREPGVEFTIKAIEPRVCRPE